MPEFSSTDCFNHNRRMRTARAQSGEFPSSTDFLISLSSLQCRRTICVKSSFYFRQRFFRYLYCEIRPARTFSTISWSDSSLRECRKLDPDVEWSFGLSSVLAPVSSFFTVEKPIRPMRVISLLKEAIGVEAVSYTHLTLPTTPYV